MHGKWRLAVKKFRRIRGIGLIIKIKQKVSDRQISKYSLILREKHEKILITSEYQIDEKEYRILIALGNKIYFGKNENYETADKNH